MNKATRLTASLSGVYAGLLGFIHGYFTFVQGGTRPAGVLFNAIGPPCQPETVYHACFPAMTLIPDLRISGILAMVVGLAVIIWAAVFIVRRHGGLVLIGLSLLFLLIGGGFIPAFTGIIAGLAGTRIHGSLTWWRSRVPGNLLDSLAWLWPWTLLAYFLWLAAQLLMGNVANRFMLSLGSWPLLLEFILLLSAVITAFSHDTKSSEPQ
ncbi:MAG: hypothetical protein R3C44_17755 [Chloroflexota bacterium]